MANCSLSWPPLPIKSQAKNLKRLAKTCSVSAKNALKQYANAKTIQEAFEKMLGPFATASRRTPPVLHCHSPGVATR